MCVDRLNPRSSSLSLFLLFIAILGFQFSACSPLKTDENGATFKSNELGDDEGGGGDDDDDDDNDNGGNPLPTDFDGEITKLKLVNVDTNQTILEFLQTQTLSLDISQLPINYSIVVEASSATAEVGSIVFGYQSNSTYRIENGAPYAIAGDSGNRPLKWNEVLVSGNTYVITATAFEAPNGDGRQGSTLTATLRITNGATPPDDPPGPTGELNPTIYLLARGEQAPAAVHVSATPTSLSKGDMDCGSNSVSATIQIPKKSDQTCSDGFTSSFKSYTKASHIANAPRQEFECMTDDQRAKLYACFRERDDRFFKGIANEMLGQDSLVNADYEWDFGDPSSRYNKVRGLNASHLYLNPGTYTIRLKVRNAAGKRGEDTMVVTIKSNSQSHSVYGTRPVIYASSQGEGNKSGANESNPIKFSDISQSITNKIVYLKRDEDYSIGAGVRLGSNSVLGAYGSTSLRRPKLIFNSATGSFLNVFNLGTSPRSIVIKDLEITSASTSVRPRGITIQGPGTPAQDVSLVNIKIGRVGVFATSDSYPTGVLVQDNVSQLNADLSRNIKDNFFYVHGRGIFVAGNVIKTKIPEGVNEGEPLFRICGMGTELVNLFNNDLFTDVPKKDNVVSIRDGNGYSVIGNRLQHGNFDIQADCAAKSWLKTPLNERTTNIIIDGNRIENANIVMKDSVKDLMIRNNAFHQRKLESNYPARRGTSLELKGSKNQRHGAIDVAVFNNTGVLSRDNTTFFKIWVSTPNVIEFSNNLFHSELTNVKAFDLEYNFSSSSLKPFKRFRNNVFVTPNSTVMQFTDGGKSISNINGASTGSSQPAGDNYRYGVSARTEMPTHGSTNVRFQPVSGSDYETDGLNFYTNSIDYDGAGRARPKTGSWTPGAMMKQGTPLGAGVVYPLNQWLDP